ATPRCPRIITCSGPIATSSSRAAGTRCARCASSTGRDVMGSEAVRFAVVATEWFNGEQRHDDGPTTLKVVDGRLAGIARGDHSQLLEGQGWRVERSAFLMPGLVDTHVHLFLDGRTTDQALRAAHLKQGVDALTE